MNIEESVKWLEEHGFENINACWTRRLEIHGHEYVEGKIEKYLMQYMTINVINEDGKWKSSVSVVYCEHGNIQQTRCEVGYSVSFVSPRESIIEASHSLMDVLVGMSRQPAKICGLLVETIEEGK